MRSPTLTKQSASTRRFPEAFLYRARCWSQKGAPEKAESDLDEAIKLGSDNPETLNNMAWLYATCPEETCRNGEKAVEYATKACELSEWKEASIVGTLAAAYAEVGQFQKAVEWQAKAQNCGLESAKTKWAFLLDQYKSGKPYRDVQK